MVRAVKAEISASGSYQNMSEGIFIAKTVDPVFTFTGNGNWSDINNWKNNLMPPATLKTGFTIIIDNTPGGQCVLDITQDITNGASLIVNTGKHLLIPGSLTIQ